MKKINKINYLSRQNDCPMGKDLQPGCSICEKCEFFAKSYWYNFGGYGENVVECKYNKPYFPGSKCKT